MPHGHNRTNTPLLTRWPVVSCLGTTGLLLGVSFALYHSCLERDHMLRSVQQIENVEMVEVKGFQQGLDFCDNLMELTFRIRQRPASISIYRPHRDVAKHVTSMTVSRIQDRYLMVVDAGQWRYPDFGEDGESWHLLGHPVRNIADIVAQYDVLVNCVAQWPFYPKMVTIVSPDGRHLQYCCRNIDPKVAKTREFVPPDPPDQVW
jgi:hypothetical protein